MVMVFTIGLKRRNMSNSDYFTSKDLYDDKTTPAVFETHCKVPLHKEIYCTYTGYCEKERAINRELLCLFCEHRKMLNIPEMIKKELKK